MNERRSVSLDFTAIVIVGIALALLIALSIGTTLYSLGERRDEHQHLDRQLDRIERTLRDQ